MDALESAEPPDPDAIAEIDVRVWVDGPGQPATAGPGGDPREGPRDGRPAVRTGPRARATDPAGPTGERAALRPALPVLALAGDLDVSEVAHTARHLEAHAPGARAMILPQVAHMIGMEIPDELAALIVEFLAPLPRWS